MYKHDVDCITGGGGGELRSGVGPAGARVQSHAVVAVTPPGDDWGGTRSRYYSDTRDTTRTETLSATLQDLTKPYIMQLI